MTLKEKIGQLFVVATASDFDQKGNKQSPDFPPGIADTTN